MPEFADRSFKKEDLQENILSIQLSLNGFSFCIRRASNQKLLVFKTHEIKISSGQLLSRRFSEWLTEEPLLQPGYGEVNVLFFDKHFSLIPQELSNKEIRNDIDRLLFDDAGDMAITSMINGIDAILNFHLPEELHKILEQHFTRFTLQHPLEKIIKVETNEEQGAQLRLLLDEKELYFVLLKNGKLNACNVFRINHSNDAVYFTLAALKQLKLPAKILPLFLAGRSSLIKIPEDAFGAYFENVDYLASQEEEPVLEKRIMAEFPCLIK